MPGIQKWDLPSADKTIIYLVVIYLIGIVGMLTEATENLFIFLVPINIIGAVLIAVLYHKKPDRRFLMIICLIFIGGFVIEWVGVKTGILFGEYTYGEGLGFKIDGVPPVMGLNWFLLVYSVTIIAGRFFRNTYAIAATGATLMVLYDLFLEPSAIRYHFWKWETDVVPIQNYVAWWVGAFVFISLLALFLRKPVKNPVAEAIFWLQLAFFACISVCNNLIV
jgi:putative membrane protein